MRILKSSQYQQRRKPVQRKLRGTPRYGKRVPQSLMARPVPAPVSRQQVKQIIQQQAEKKYLNGGSNVPVTATGSFVYLNDSILNGTTNSTRIGDNIQIRSIHALMQLTNINGIASGNNFRIIFGRWNTYWISSPSVGSLFNDPSDPINSLYERLALEQGRWTPIYDSRFTLYNTAASGKIQELKEVNFFGETLPKPRLTYNSANNPDGLYFFLFISDYAGLSPFPSVSWRWRMTYTDV